LKIRICLISIAVAMLVACGSPADPEPPAGGYANLVILGDNIVTMDKAMASAGGVAVRGETIALVGARDKVLALAGPDTRVEELGDRALIPGLIDTHGHFPFTARLSSAANLSSPPVGTAETVDDIVELLKKHIADHDLPAGAFVFGYGYDDSLLAAKSHPTRDDLDRASTDHPIGIMHVSGHLAVANSLALAGAGITAESEDPDGGVIRRRDGSREPNGVLEETAAFPVYAPMMMAGPGDFGPTMKKAAIYYASFGITTAQDGAANPDDVASMKALAAAEPLAIDIAAFPRVNEYSLPAIEQLRVETDYTGGFRVAGAKVSLDGSPQGRTAWLTEPYLQGPPGAAADYVAYGTIDPEHYKAAAAILVENGVPILAHANGDAAIDLMIDGVASAVQGKALPDHRSVIIHAQLMREDQLDRAKELGIVPSFFSAHPFFWGDWHRLSFGDDRALNISPVRWAIERDVPFTIHNDAPVIPPDMMRLLWSTVNRKTRSGFVLGEHQRATVYEALYAMTQAAAWQYFEEDRKGSITAGKQADLVILDRNPLDVDPDTLKDIAILETIARGRTVYSAAGSDPSRSELDIAACTPLSGDTIASAFADVVDEADVRDLENGRAKNHWYDDGRFTSDWSAGDMKGSVAGTWHVEEDQRCVVIESGLKGSEGKKTCSPIYACDAGLVSVNADGSIHGVHTLSKM